MASEGGEDALQQCSRQLERRIPGSAADYVEGQFTSNKRRRGMRGNDAESERERERERECQRREAINRAGGSAKTRPPHSDGTLSSLSDPAVRVRVIEWVGPRVELAATTRTRPKVVFAHYEYIMLSEGGIAWRAEVALSTRRVHYHLPYTLLSLSQRAENANYFYTAECAYALIVFLRLTFTFVRN